MKIAIHEAEIAAQKGEVPVGAVIISDNCILGASGNSPIQDNNPTAHAEINAIQIACSKVSNYRLTNTTLYVTLEPCIMCMGAIIQARIDKVVFGAFDPKSGAAGSIYSIGTDGNLNHKVEIIGGIFEEKCSKIIKDFFILRRKMKK